MPNRIFIINFHKVVMLNPTVSYSFISFACTLYFLLTHYGNCIAVPPTWLTSSYVQANSYKLINGDLCNCVTGNSSTPTATMLFATAFTIRPNLGYGISNYQGNDTLGSEMFEVNRTGLTTTYFSVLVKITGYTHIWVLEVRYIAISKLFPHHLNSFDNVPVNYTAGPLTNFSVPSMSVKTFRNTINYQNQAILSGSTYTQFSLPLQNNKILLFMTSLFIDGTTQTGSNIYPINLYITATPLATITYQFYVQFSMKAIVDRLHFSMIVFDKVDVQSSGQFLLIYDRICYPVTGGFYPFPAQFLTNFMVGLAQFSSQKTAGLIHFVSNYVTVNGSYGIQMPKSQPRFAGKVPLSRFCFTYFYIKTWLCPNNTFYDDGTKMCISCPISGCLDCSNISYCQSCDQSNGFYLNVTGLCQRCNITGCINCSSLTVCHDCDQGMNYVHNNDSCMLCDTTNNFFADHVTHTCTHCNISNCLTCQTLFECKICNTNISFYLTPSKTCQYCDPNQNHFIDPVNLHCDQCTVDFCINCSSLTTCRQCNETERYFLNTSDSQCYLCTANNCDICLNITVCSVCAVGYHINITTLLCQVCTLIGCKNCTSLIQCFQCNQTLGYFINSTESLCSPCIISNCILCQNLTSCLICNQTEQYFDNDGECIKCNLTGCLNCSSLTTCYQCDFNSSYGLSYVNADICSGCNESCICDGYGTPWIPSIQQCTPICGDGLLRLNQYCDDNNTYSGDGCSTTCTVEPFWNCDKSQPSICNQIKTVNAEFLSIEKSGCNSFKIISRVPEFPLSQISNNIFILNEGVKITTKEQNGTQILIYAEYNRDIAGQTIMLQFSPMEIFNITYNPTIPALYYSLQQCQIQGSVETMLKAAQIISYAILIISLLSCKIVGLQLFGVLQLSYFTLSSHNFLNVYLAPLTKFKTFNGLNIQISPQSTELPDSIQKMNLSSSFINNCNVMLIVLFGQILISFITYLASKIAKNDKLKTVSLRLLKQGFVTLILFNIFNISFSAGVHWKYASSNDDNYIISTLILVGTLLAAVVSVLAMELTAKEDYGQFKNKFKQNWVCRFYVPLTVIYRMALGFYSAVKSDYEYGSLLVMAFSLAFIMYTIVNLPFLNVFQDYRCCLVHVTMLYTLLTTNYYRGMKSTTPMEIKGHIYTPSIIELVLIMSCIALSFLVLVYEIYQIIKQCRKKRKTETKTEIRHQPNLTQQSFENIN